MAKKWLGGLDPQVIENTQLSRTVNPHINLAIIGSHSINGVAKLHTELLKEDTLRDFHGIYPRGLITRPMALSSAAGYKCGPASVS